MEVTYFYVALVIGLFISLLCEEVFGITCGGLIVPGYVAMVCDDVINVLVIFAVSVLIYFIINHVLPHFVILFGKRRFVATIIVGVIIKLILELLFPALMPFSTVVLRGVGVITPALIANHCAKQGFRYTIPAALVASYFTFGVVTLLFWIF